MALSNNVSKKKSFKLPHTYVIIFMLILAAALLTWIIPAGHYERVLNEVTGKKVILPDKFSVIPRQPVGIFQIPGLIMKSLSKSSLIIFVILIVGGAFEVIIDTEVFQAIISKLSNKSSKSDKIFIPIITTIFAFACTTLGVNTFIGFAPIAVMLARAMGYDALVGLSLVALGGAVGFSTGTLNPFTTGVAQGIAGLPMFSGIGYRFFAFAIFLVVTNLYIINYARKIKKNPELSYVYDLELKEKKMNEGFEKFSKIEPRHYLVLAVVIGCFGVLIYGSINLKWKLEQNAAMFIWMAILGGFAGGFSPSKIATIFTKGAKKLVGAALIIGLARTVAVILDAGSILDTVVFYLSSVLAIVPAFLQGTAMFITNIVINLFITSGSGQAGVVMPVLIPVADIVGMTRQTAVLAFNFGDGFCNYILPTSSALMGFLGAANIPYEKWVKYIWKLFLIWIATGACILIGAYLIKFGPF